MHDVVKWLGSLAAVIGFGVAMGHHPILFVAEADILAKNKGPWRKLAWMLGGFAVGATLLFLLFHIVDPTNFVDQAEGDIKRAAVNRAVDTVASVLFLGAALAFLGWRIAVPQRAPKKPQRVKNTQRDLDYLMLGFGCTFVGSTTLPLMYLTVRAVETISTEPLIQLSVYVLFLLSLFAPFTVLAWAWEHAPRVTAALESAYRRIRNADTRPWVAAFLAAAGAVFVWMAVHGRP